MKKKLTLCHLLNPAVENESQSLPKCLNFMLIFHFIWPNFAAKRILLKKKVSKPMATLVNYTRKSFIELTPC